MVESELVEQLEEIDAMFVQTAMGFVSQGGRIRLRGVAPSTLYFSDRPQRIVGHLSTAEFVSLWGEGEDSFSTDPPNAVVSFIGESAPMPSDAVLTITGPDLEGDDLSYVATILEGELPLSATGCTLFIDPFGRPLSPISVAGMRRRTRRKTRRRLALLSAG
jgi:hypothetical protein